MSDRLEKFSNQYASALRRYLVKREEAALQQAYVLGRRALAEKIGLVEMVSIHQKALADSLKQRLTSSRRRFLTEAADEFFTESVGPFEMTLRGFQESMDELKQMNELLEKRVMERTEAMRRTAESLRALFQASPLAVIELDSNGHILMWNPAAECLFGWKQEEVLGLPNPAIPAGQQKDAQVLRENALHGETIAMLETTRQRRNGSLIPVSLWLAPLYDSERKALGVVAVIADITERKRAEEALRKSEATLRAIAELNPFGVWDCDPNGGVVYLSQSWLDMVGMTLEQCSQFGWMQRYAPGESEKMLEAWQRCREAGSRWEYEHQIRDKDGVNRWVLSRGFPLRDESGRISKWVGLNIDITELKRMELQLKEAAEKYSTLFDTTSDGVWIHNLNGEILEVNDAYCRLCGYSRDELTHMQISRLEAAENPDEIADHIRRVIKMGGHDRFESRHRRKNGSIFDVDITALYFEKEGGRIAIFVRDITERKKIEQALRESEAKASALIKYAPTGIYEIDYRGPSFISINDAMCQILGYSREELFEMDPTRLLDHDGQGLFTDRLRRQLAGEKIEESVEFRVRKKDGSFIQAILNVSINLGGDPNRALVVAYDITERKQMEDQLRKSRDELDMRVQERTEELQAINEELRTEIEERLRVEMELRDSENRLRELSKALLNAQEGERKLVAREIHDSLGASLAATKFKVEDALKGTGDDSIQAKAALKSIIPIIQGTIDEARRIQMSLRPSMLDDLGILPTINWFCRQFEKTYSRISLKKEINIEEDELPESLKTVIYRVLQEALNNAAKHSNASVVLLYLRKEHQQIQLIIRDSGKGFSLEEAYSRKGIAKGLGLDSMRERTEFSGGSFSIESSEGAGTVIRATWPLNR